MPTAFLSLAFLLVGQIALSHGFKIQPKIAGGEPVNTTVPYFVSLDNEMRICSGSLLSDSWILTAAHCLIDAVPTDVYFGIQPNGSHEATARVDVQDQYIYPGYYKDGRRYDIGLMKLPRPIQFTENVHPVKLPNNCDDLNIPETMRAIGIGATQIEHTFKDNDECVRHVELKTVQPTSILCIELDSFLDPPSPSLFFTASPDAIFRSILPGDSGGPVVRQNDDKQFGVAKAYITSDIHPYDIYQMYTKISYFFDWILHVTALNLPKCREQAPINGNIER